MGKLFTILSGTVLFFLSLINCAFAQQEINLTGKVTDAATGDALIGVSVIVKGTNIGTETDANGAFMIKAPSNANISFTYIGYITQVIPLSGQNSLQIKLQPEAQELNPVVVVGYGTQRKVDITGAIAQVKGAEISKQSSPNPISALQGKVAGVQITNSGSPGSSPQITIRGVGTVYGSTNPLYVVDGVWFDDVSFLNPADIENVSVLKDASSEAIYGIRAANGVVLITTKKGSLNSKPVINYNGYVGNQVVTNAVKMANGPQYATMIDELDVLGGATARYADPNSFGTTDWYRQVLRNAFTMNQQVSVNGGSEKSTYNVSFGYLDQDGIVETNTFKRYTAKIQQDIQLFKNLKVGYVISGAANKSNDIDGAIFHQLFAAVPIVPVRYADGSYGDPNDFNVTSSALFNPQVTVDFFNQQSYNYRLNGSAYAELQFAKHFTFRSSAGGDFGQGEVDNYAPVYTATFSQRNTISRYTETTNKTRNWIIENTLTYNNQFDDHNITVLLGQGAQSYKFNQSIASAENVPDVVDGSHFLSLGNNFNIIDVDNGIPPAYPLHNTISSYFARANYAFKNRYLINATIRADGSSKFSGSNRWGYFPSIGAGWVISEEDFMKDQKIFNNLKLRGSWGKIGNMSVPANLSVLTVTQTPAFIYVGGDGSTAVGANINTIVPPMTYWERGAGTDVGLEAAVLDSKLNLEVDFYNKKTENAIFAIPILLSLGTTGSNIIANQATFQNRGWEFALTWRDSNADAFSYTLSGNFSVNQNKVLSVTSGVTPIYQAVNTVGSNNYNTRTVVGQPIGQFFGLQVDGVFQTADEVANYKSATGAVIQPTAIAGDFKYRDINGDGVIDDRDRIVLGNPNPKYAFGLNTNFTYKSFDLTIDAQGLAGVDLYNANIGLRYGTENYTEDFYRHRWHGSGTSNTYPSVFIAGGQNNRSNSFYVQNGNYVRIRNLQLGYSLPSAITNKWNITKLRFYVNAQNSLNFFSYKGFSPEVGGGPTKAGVDANVYPLYATYNFGVNLTF